MCLLVSFDHLHGFKKLEVLFRGTPWSSSPSMEPHQSPILLCVHFLITVKRVQCQNNAVFKTKGEKVRENPGFLNGKKTTGLLLYEAADRRWR